MGEEAAAAPCMMRSNSNPLFASCEFKEGDPLRALTTSISFGRFLTEPLNWERWSSFSHNRTLEDVQKYSRPGVVAEKKAFFEARYKNFAFKKPAKSPNKENKAPNYSPESNLTTNISPVAVANMHSVIDQIWGNEPTNRLSEEIVSSVDVHTPSTTGLVFSNSGNIDDIISSTIQVEQEKTTNENIPSPGTNLVFSQVSDVEDNFSSTNQVLQEQTSPENIPLENHQPRVKISNRSIHVDNNKKRYIKDAASDRDKLSRQKKPEISLVVSLSRNGAYKNFQSPRKALTPAVHPQKAARDVKDKTRSDLQSLHMSVNFPSARNKNGASNTISKPKERPIQPLTRVVQGRENKRSKTPIDRSVNGNRTVALKPISTNHSETSSPCTKKPKSTTVPSSFSFRSDERAAKRKEFFQKLEEKGNANETEKIQLQPKLKEKVRSDNKKLRWSAAIEANPSTSEPKVPIISMQKVSPTRQGSPKLGSKGTPKPVEDTLSQSPPWRSSSKPKNFIEINKKKLSSYMEKKKMHAVTLMSVK